METSPRTIAVVTAAGSGVRMGAAQAKQFLDLDGRPILAWTLKRFQSCTAVDAVIVVVPPGAVDYCRRTIIEPYGLSKVKAVIGGGARRQDSVRLGIEAARGGYDLVVVHDGVRPFVTPGMIARAVDAAGEFGAVATGVPARDTVKEVDGDRWVQRTYDRRRIWLIQTPQVFRYGDISRAHRRALAEGWGGVTDDAQLMERAGVPVRVIEGSEDNIKVTTPHDLALCRFLLRREAGEGLGRGSASGGP